VNRSSCPHEFLDVEVDMKMKKQSGQVLIGVAAAFVVLAGFAGLAIDMGTMRFQKRLQQTAADAAAIAGASNLTYAAGAWSSAAQNAATQNGFQDGGGAALSNCTPTAAIGTTCVELHNGPADVSFNGTTISAGSHPGDANYVEALVAKVQPTYFMTIFGVDREVVVARAVATNTGGGPLGGNGCIYSLGTPTAQLNWNKAGLGSTGVNYINGPACGVVDNGNMVANGAISVKMGSIGVGGSVSLPNNSTPDCSQAQPAGVCPTPVTGMPYSGDPFSGKWPIPSPPAAGTVTTATTANGPVTTYTPGTYTDIHVTGNTIFEPGLYYITGSLRVNAGTNVVAGGTTDFSGGSSFTSTYSGGATFYITNGADVTINGGSSVQMYAPHSGTYEGLLFYQDPLDTQQMTINGTSNSFFEGAIYAPKADVDFSGTADFNGGANYTVIVADQFLVSGGAYVNLKADFSGLSSGPLTGALKYAVLVE
jgi:Putative Flp pilus-assembly TadE/G-like